MTAVSLALGGLTVPSVVGGGGGGSSAEAQTSPKTSVAVSPNVREVGGDWVALIPLQDEGLDSVKTIEVTVQKNVTDAGSRREAEEQVKAFDSTFASQDFVVEFGGSNYDVAEVTVDNVADYTRKLTFKLNGTLDFNNKAGTSLVVRLPGGGDKGYTDSVRRSVRGYLRVGDAAVSGVVKDQYDNPVEGVRVELHDNSGGVREATTDGTGRVDWRDVSPGNYTVRVETPGGYTAPADRTVTINPGENFDLGDLTVQRQTGSINGSVAKIPEGANLQVRATGNDEATRGVSKTVDVVDGSYSILDLPTGNYVVEVVAESVPEGYSVSGGQSATVTHNGTDTKNFEISSGRGKLTVNLSTDTPVEINAVHDGVTYSFGKPRDSFTWNAAPVGEYAMEVVASQGYTVEADTSASVPEDGEAVVNVTVTRDRGSVSGLVTPGSVTKVELVDTETGERREVPVDGSGNLNLDGVPTGDYIVEVKPKDGYTAPAKQTVTVEKDKNTELDNLNPTTSTPEPTTSTPEPTTSTPEPTTSTPEPTTSTPEPTTSTPEPTTSTPEPTTSTPEPTTSTPEPTTSTPVDEDKPTGSIVGKVTDDKGDPLPSTDENGNQTPSKVTVTDDEGNKVRESVETDENGEFTIPELPDGEYVVSVETPEGHNDPKPQVVEVKDGQPTEIPPFVSNKPTRELEDKSDRIVPGTIGGWLLDDGNNPIRDSEIRLVKENVVDPSTGELFDYEVPITVDEDGFFVTPEIDFEYFPDGEAEFDMDITLPEGWPDVDVNGDPLDRKVTVKKDEPTNLDKIRVQAPETQSIEGRVDDGNGNAVPGTVVVVTDPRGNSKVVPVEEDGSFKIDDVIPGVHEVEVLTPGNDRDVDPIKVPVREADEVELPEIHLTANASLKLEKQVWGRDADYNEQVEDEDGNLVDDVMTVKTGEDLYYEFFITNTGDTPITDIEIDDPELDKRNIELTMPEGWTAESELVPGATEVIKAKMQAPDAFDFNNIATVNGKTPTGENIGSAPDSAYTKFLNGSVEKKVNARFATNPDEPARMGANDAMSFTYEVKNTGSAPMVNVTLTDAVYEGEYDPSHPKFDPEQMKKVQDLEIIEPEGFNGTLLPGQKVIFTAEIPEGLAPGMRHHNSAEARGELPKRPARGRGLAGEPDYGEDPSSTLIISPRENLKGNAHIIVDEGAALAGDARAVLWIDEDGNGKQDPGESISGLDVSLVPTDGSPAIAGTTNEDGNVLFESAPYGEYTFQIKNPGDLRLVDPKDPKNNSFKAGSVLETKLFKIEEEDEVLLDIQLEKGSGVSGGGGLNGEGDGAIDGEVEGSSLGKCLASASSVSNPVAWLVPLGLLGAVMGGIGVMFEDELNQISAQANAALREVMPETNFGSGFSFERPQWMNDIQAQIDGVNRQLAEINPAAPAAAGGVTLLAIAGLLTGLYYASCELGWAEPKEGSSSEGSSSEVEGGSSAKDAEGSSSKEAEAEAESETQPEEASN
ncbi:carboxypeptidase regulatory-like domain-containing protein [Corynebacterium afermentans]